MSNPFIGQIACFSFDFVPDGWARCDGQMLKVGAFPDLFAVIGTTYGSGKNSFAVPDLRGRVPLHTGAGAGLSSYVHAQAGGTESVTLINDNMPAHTHPINARSGTKLNRSPSGNNFGGAEIYSSGPLDSVMHTSAVGMEGGNQPFETMPPYLAMNWCIALRGTMPVAAPTS